jgi:hypothetical protein
MLGIVQLNSVTDGFAELVGDRLVTHAEVP